MLLFVFRLIVISPRYTRKFAILRTRAKEDRTYDDRSRTNRSQILYAEYLSCSLTMYHRKKISQDTVGKVTQQISDRFSTTTRAEPSSSVKLDSQQTLTLHRGLLCLTLTQDKKWKDYSPRTTWVTVPDSLQLKNSIVKLLLLRNYVD